MNEPLLTELKTHFEFAGYEVSMDKDNDLVCRHPRHYNCIAVQFKGGVLLVAGFGVTMPETAELEVLRALNSFNAASGVSFAYLTAKRAISVSGWYSLPYTKASFSTFLDRWHAEQTDFAVTKVLDFAQAEKSVDSTSSEQTPRAAGPTGTH